MTELQDLSPEQQAVVTTWGRGLAVMAGAGSGKTTTLTIKCAELVRMKPDARFAAVSFTERSASDLRAKLAQRLTAIRGVGEGGPLSGHWVMTIHGLCGAIIREYPREAGYDGEETMLSEGEGQLLWERATEALWTEELPEDVQAALLGLLERESRDGVFELLRRVKQLHGFGVLGFLGKAEDHASRALETLGRYVLERYDRLKRRRGALDFDDLERGADRALDHPAVRAAFHKRFELVLIDEFQDTNPVQAGIIERLVRPDLSNLCVVGDPKQSIYRFRDADVSVFEDFCARLPVNLALTWNFRSRPPIIEYSNRVCAKAFAASDMRYDALVPRKPAAAEDAVARLDVRSPSELGAWIRGEIERGTGLHDMALLLRRIRGNEKWLKALTAAGIPIAIGSGGLFWEDPRVRELVAFLKWWDNPGNSLSGGIFLRAPWMAVPDGTLDEWVRRDATWQEPFFRSRHAVARALGPLRGRIARPAELLLELLVDEGVEAELGAPLLGLWHRCEELSSRGLDFHAVVAELALASQESRRERDVPPPRNQGQLSVLTLHGSKGLEFPHVILVDLGPKPRAANAPLLFWDRNRGTYLGARDADGERDKKNPLELAWRESERKKSLAESKRVFYVALTRAQERLVLVCPELPEGKDVFDPEKAYDQDDWRAWIECAGADLPRLTVPQSRRPQPQPQTEQKLKPKPKPQTPTPTPTRPRHSVTEWNLLSRCERAYEWTFIRPVAVAEGVAEIGLFTGRKLPRLAEEELSQRELGTRVHSCLERGDFDGLKALEREAGSERFQAEPVISWAMSSEWMAPPRLETGRDVWTELEFEAPLGGQALVGSIDRLVKDGSRYSIIDFKVTEKPKSVEALLDSYQVQMELYGWALRALDPGVNPRNLEALLVNISARTIQAMPVPLGQVPVEPLAEAAASILAGRAGKASPGMLCRVCEFRPQCAEGRAYREPG